MSKNPLLIPQPFANNGNKNTIQNTRQTGQDAEDATWNDGFPNVTMQPIESGGLPPKGMDFNGIFNALSAPIVHMQKGGQYYFDADYAESIGGYKIGAVLMADTDNKLFVSTIANNKNDPNKTAVGWEVLAGDGFVEAATASKAGIVKVLNILNSTDTLSALSAAQGKALNDKISSIKIPDATSSTAGITRVINNLNSTDANSALSAAQGKALNDKIASNDSNAVHKTGDETINGVKTFSSGIRAARGGSFNENDGSIFMMTKNGHYLNVDMSGNANTDRGRLAFAWEAVSDIRLSEETRVTTDQKGDYWAGAGCFLRGYHIGVSNGARTVDAFYQRSIQYCVGGVWKTVWML